MLKYCYKVTLNGIHRIGCTSDNQAGATLTYIYGVRFNNIPKRDKNVRRRWIHEFVKRRIKRNKKRSIRKRESNGGNDDDDDDDDSVNAEEVKVRSRLGIFWPDDETYYPCTVSKNRGSKWFVIIYDDAVEERFDLSNE